MSEYTFKIDLNVLNHLGLGLYSGTPAVLTEIIANAYDAEATEVTINFDKANGKITISDNGHGMSADDVQHKFLNVGYARRNESDFTLNKKRRVMGRKGIGKLAMFSLANMVSISTKQIINSPIGIKVNVSELKQAISDKKEYRLGIISPSEKLDEKQGTVIELSDLNKNITIATESNLKLRLARRFSVIGTDEDLSFNIIVDGQKITIADRGFHSDVQFFWSFGGKEAEDNLRLCKNLEKDNENGNNRMQELETVIPSDSGLTIRGYIASVVKPKQLKSQDTNINQISIFANGRVFQEDILPILSNSDHFNSYLVGEIHADFLDQDEVDRATASREAIKQNDPKYIALLGHLRTQMLQIANTWDAWRKVLGYENLPDKNPFVEEWLNTLDKRDKKSAEKLIMSVYNNQFSSDEEQNDEYKRDLYRSTIIGFEKLKAKKQLDKLDSITSVTSPEFQSIFNSLDDMEETYYWDITNSRLNIIKKFKEIVDKEELEKIAQEYLFEHLWLLDPTWDRIKGSEQLELTLTNELKRIKPDTDSGARIDIAYRNSAGRQIIIELKRPGLENLKFFKLLEQAKKYKDAITQFLREHNDVFQGSTDAIDICLLLEKDITTDEDQRNMLKNTNARIITYKGLIENAFKVYQDYLNANKEASKIDQLVQKI